MDPDYSNIRDQLSLLQAVVTLETMMRKRGNEMHYLCTEMEEVMVACTKHVDRVMNVTGLTSSLDVVHETVRLAQTLGSLLEKDGNILGVCYQPRFGSWMALMVLEHAVGVGVVRSLTFTFRLRDDRSVTVEKYLIACGKSFTSHASKALIFNSQVMTEMFSFQELGYDISSHSLAPKYRLMSRDEVERKFKSTDIEALKRLPSNDAMARFMGLQPGDVVVFKRMFMSHNPEIQYRHVVPHDS